MMFPKSILATSLMVTLAVANPSYPAPPTGTSNQCCAVVSNNSNSVISLVAGIIGALISGVTSNIGFGCSDINVLSNECSATAVNCNSSPIGSPALIYIGCVPITLS